MPPIEIMEHERIAYVKGMEKYLRDLKSMSIGEAKKMSHENLVRSQIIKESGEFTAHYMVFSKN